MRKTQPSAPSAPLEPNLVDSIENNSADDESQRRTLFLGDLDRSTTHEDIVNLFSSYGEVKEVRLKHAKVTKHPLGYGFIDMVDHESAALCIEQLDGAMLKGKQISVRWASRNKKLFIANLGRSTSLSDVLSICQVYGTVCPEQSFLSKSESGNIYAVIEFDRREAAEAAKLALHGTVLNIVGDETTIFANWEQSLSYRTNQSLPSPHQSPFPYYSVHISFRTTSANARVTEKTIYQAYKSFGKMTTVTIKNIFLDQSTQTQSGFGFIHFETIEGARNAVNGGGSCIQIGGVNYNAEFSKHLMKRGEKKMTNSHTGTQPSVVPSLPIPEVPWGPPSPRYHTQFPSGHYALYPGFTYFPSPRSFGSPYPMPYSALEWQDPYAGGHTNPYSHSYGPY